MHSENLPSEGQANPLLNAVGGRSTQDIEMDEIPGRRTTSPSIVKTIKSFPVFRGISTVDDVSSVGLEPHYEWVKGVVICAMGSATVAFINLVLAIAAIALSYSKYGGGPADAMALYQGKCSLSKGWATGLHLLINILSTIVLAASNYCMQNLSAPSRADVDRAHAKRTWLDIGTSGLRNLWFVNTRRRILWFLLLITSLPIHLLYNSVIYSVLTTYEYPVLVASSDLDFQANPLETLGDPESDRCFDDFVGRPASDLGAILGDGSRFERLSKQECIDRYANDYLTDRRTVVVLVDHLASAELMILPMSHASQHPTSRFKFNWMCVGHYEGTPLCTKDIVMDSVDTWSVLADNWTKTDYTTYVPLAEGVKEYDQFDFEYFSNYSSEDLPESDLKTDMLTLASFIIYDPREPEMRNFLDDASNWQNTSWAASVTYDVEFICPDGRVTASADSDGIYPVKGCLSERVEENCKLVFSLPISMVVIACNIVKVACMFLAAKENRCEVLVTIGDAVASFLNNPDPTTTGRCLMEKRTLGKGENPWKPRSKGRSAQRMRPGTQSLAPETATAFLSGKKSWFRAAGAGQWTLAISLAVLCLATGGTLLGLALVEIDRNYMGSSMSMLWSLGFGETSPYTLLEFGSPSILSMVLLANSPQLYVSIVYFAYNNLLTAMILSAEYTSYGLQRKSLRVSWPKGSQRSTYYLTLPYLYSVPLMCASTVLHWLLSQSIFYVRIDLEPMDLDDGVVETASTCGYSPIPIILTIGFGSLMTLSLILLGMRRFKSPVPLASNCSAVISAACHRPPDDTNAALKPVMWGEVKTCSSGSNSPTTESVATSESRRYQLVSEHEDSCDAEATAGLEQGSSQNGTYDAGAGGEDASTGYAHCCFTSKDVVAPTPEKLYM